MTQRQMGTKVDLEQQRQLMDMVGEEEERERARLLSLTLNHAGDWLNTPQSRRWGCTSGLKSLSSPSSIG